MGTNISVVINTLNEEKNLPYALGSVAPWAEEIIVVDMHSDDRTIEVARKFGAKTFLHERMGFADPARNFALSKASSAWILILDADEMVSPELARRLIGLSKDTNVDVVRLPRRNYFFGAALQGAGWGERQDAQPRFFRKSALQCTHKIHDCFAIAQGSRVSDLECSEALSLIHFNYRSVAHFLEKMNRYTDIEALQALERGDSFSYLKSSWLMFKEVANRFLRKQGYLDGWRGWVLCFFMAGYRLTIQAKLKELTETGNREKVDRLYQEIAEKTLSGYETWDTNDADR